MPLLLLDEKIGTMAPLSWIYMRNIEPTFQYYVEALSKKNKSNDIRTPWPLNPSKRHGISIYTWTTIHIYICNCQPKNGFKHISSSDWIGKASVMEPLLANKTKDKQVACIACVFELLQDALILWPQPQSADPAKVVPFRRVPKPFIPSVQEPMKVGSLLSCQLTQRLQTGQRDHLR